MPVIADPRQARSVRTRAQLVEAARAALVELGLSSTPTSIIAQRAGVSHGSLFRHFPTKTDLLVAVVQEILADLVVGFGVELVAEAHKRPPTLDPVKAACAALWRVFRRPDMRVVLEIYVAARTDPALAERLEPVIDRHQATILTRARQLFPDAAAVNPDLPRLPEGTAPANEEAFAGGFDDAVLAIVYAMQGAAVGLFCPDPDREVAHLAFLERLARRELRRGSTGGAPANADAFVGGPARRPRSE